MSAPVGLDQQADGTPSDGPDEGGTGLGPSHEAGMQQAPTENFSVASVFLPGRQRRQLMAIYGVARLIDDVGDESTGDRGALLDRLDTELDRVFSGQVPEHPTM